ncbi:cell wall hydrolase [Brevibacillus fluminis]|uniref:Cell wall hydrolase n=1 Tax=Brevibacillus fluminis TaxID=511487 RepID=A0A3M8DQB2_9BACL|nr:cell wall hydrolase [Brevibacillus fluminis]RNB90303.1 cell wall hydrolase [Brevibacillus fluminis]
MAVIKVNSSVVDLLARLLRAEAEGEEELGQLMVGNVGVNRILANCLDFKNIRTMRQMVYQSPGGYESVTKPYFYQRAREREKRLARRTINGEWTHPATNALWFYRPTGACPDTWWDQRNSGRYKAHCFFVPTRADCPRVF